MNNPPVLRRDTGPQAGKQFSCTFREQTCFVDDHKIEAGRMPGRSIRRQRLQCPGPREYPTGVWRTPDVDFRQPGRLGDRRDLVPQFAGFLFRDAGNRATPARHPERPDQVTQGEHRADSRLGILATACQGRLVRTPSRPQEVLGEVRERHRLPRQRMPRRNHQSRRGPPRQLADRIGPEPAQGEPRRAPWLAPPGAARDTASGAHGPPCARRWGHDTASDVTPPSRRYAVRKEETPTPKPPPSAISAGAIAPLFDPDL